MNPLWVDARDYLTSQGQPVTTHGLNEAMNLLASNPQLRPSAVKAGGGAAGIAAGLGVPTDQIVSAPLAPPVATGGSPSPSPRATSRSKQGASSGNRTAGGTSASGKTVKDVPAGVGNYAAAGGQNNANAQGITPPSGYTPTAAPSSPVGTAQAGTGADDPGFLAHLMSGDYNGRVAALGGAAAAALGAWLMGKGGSATGARPRAGGVDPLAGAVPYGTPNAVANPADMPMQPYGTPGVFNPVDPNEVMSPPHSQPAPDPLANAAPWGTTNAMADPADILAGAAPYSTPGAMHSRPPNQSPVPYSGEAPQTMPPQLAAIIEDVINGKPNNNIIGTRRGTQKPYSGAVPAGAQSGIPDEIMQLLMNKPRTDTMGGSR